MAIIKLVENPDTQINQYQQTNSIYPCHQILRVKKQCLLEWINIHKYKCDECEPTPITLTVLPDCKINISANTKCIDEWNKIHRNYCSYCDDDYPGFIKTVHCLTCGESKNHKCEINWTVTIASITLFFIVIMYLGLLWAYVF